MSTKLFKRNWCVTVDTLRLPKPVDITFKVEKSIKSEPNTCELKIYNLTKEHRKQLTESKKVSVRLEAGYENALTAIFIGELRNIYTQRDGTDLITVIEGKDAGRSYQSARVNRSFPAGTKYEVVAKACAQAMGIDQGNVDDAIAAARITGLGTVYPEGTTTYGPASRALTRVLSSAGLTWSVQDGVLQVLRGGRALQSTSVLLNSGTGLIESPVIDITKKKKKETQVVTAKMLIIPGVYPGRQLRIQSDVVTGTFRADKLTYIGDTRGSDWYIEADCKQLI